LSCRCGFVRSIPAGIVPVAIHIRHHRIIPEKPRPNRVNQQPYITRSESRGVSSPNYYPDRARNLNVARQNTGRTLPGTALPVARLQTLPELGRAAAGLRRDESSRACRVGSCTSGSPIIQPGHRIASQPNPNPKHTRRRQRPPSASSRSFGPRNSA